MNKIYKEGEIGGIAKELLMDISVDNKRDGAAVLAFVGDLGAGKTTFVKSLARLLGIEEDVVSPTFVISKSYDTSDKNLFKKLIHIDAYRLKTKKDLENIGFFEQLQNKENLIIIEWADLVFKWLPASAKRIDFEYSNETSRKIIY